MSEIQKAGSRPPEGFLLGGRAFIAIKDRTFEQQIHFDAVLVDAGLDFESHEEESPLDFANRIAKATVKSRRVLELLGCILVPEEVGVDGWTPEEAKRTALFLGHVRGDGEIAQLQVLTSQMLIGFFERGLASVWISQRSSSGHTASGRTASSQPEQIPGAPPSSLEAPIPTAAGAPS